MALALVGFVILVALFWAESVRQNGDCVHVIDFALCESVKGLLQ